MHFIFFLQTFNLGNASFIEKNIAMGVKIVFIFHYIGSALPHKVDDKYTLSSKPFIYIFNVFDEGKCLVLISFHTLTSISREKRIH